MGHKLLSKRGLGCVFDIQEVKVDKRLFHFVLDKSFYEGIEEWSISLVNEVIEFVAGMLGVKLELLIWVEGLPFKEAFD